MKKIVGRMPSVFLKQIYRSAVLANLFFAFVIDASHAQNQCRQPFVFFDLGGTLVDTDTYNFKPMFYMKGALSYLIQLSKNGHKLGLLIDVPESWGRDLPQFSLIKDAPTAKWKRTLAFLRGEIPEDQSSWDGPQFEARFFGTFDGKGATQKFIGNVFLPRTNAERKSTGNNIIFVRARAAADREGCEAVYMGEELKQMKMAEDAGMIPYAVGLPHRPFYLPVQKIAAYVEEFKKQKNLRHAREMEGSFRGHRSISRGAYRDPNRPLQ